MVLEIVNLKGHEKVHDRIVKSFSGGQQARLLLASALVQNPDLLLLDEPPNHINFRHLPVIAAALDRYQGAMILVSHVPEFVAKIRIDNMLDLEK
ncbi:MAG TPA: ATP-binding cassette domain-containing protein [Candidatus Paceibacterota bacterium]